MLHDVRRWAPTGGGPRARSWRGRRRSEGRSGHKGQEAGHSGPRHCATCRRVGLRTHPTGARQQCHVPAAGEEVSRRTARDAVPGGRQAGLRCTRPADIRRDPRRRCDCGRRKCGSRSTRPTRLRFLRRSRTGRRLQPKLRSASRQRARPPCHRRRWISPARTPRRPLLQPSPDPASPCRCRLTVEPAPSVAVAPTAVRPDRRRGVLAGVAALALLFMIVGLATQGPSGGLLMIGLVALIVGLVAVVRGQARWALVASRGIGGAVAGAGLVALTLGGALAPSPAPTVASSRQPIAAPTSTPSAASPTSDEAAIEGGRSVTSSGRDQ